jgi:4-carboxymuconolactone decarboxylase
VSAVLSPEREALVDLSAAIASRNEAAVERALAFAERFATRAGIEEALLQSHLFVGFPVALEAVALWRRMSPAIEPPPRADAPAGGWLTRGESVCRTVYGSNYEKLRGNVSLLHPDLDAWMVDGGYGRVIGREGLDLVTRELCIAALLAVWGSPRQLHSHLRGALNAGATPEEVTAAVEVACRYLDLADAVALRSFRERIRGSERGASASDP